MRITGSKGFRLPPLKIKIAETIRTIRVKTFGPENRIHATKHYSAGAGKHFTQEGIDGVLATCANQLEKHFPEHEYKCVEVQRSRRMIAYNIVWIGRKDEAMHFAPAADPEVEADGASEVGI